MCRRCGRPPPCPEPPCPAPTCQPPPCAPPFPKATCAPKLGCYFSPKRHPCPPEPCPTPQPCTPKPCPSKRPCSPKPCAKDPCAQPPCGKKKCPPKKCSPPPCSPPPCPRPYCQPPPCNQPCPPQPCTSCCAKKPCSSDPCSHCPPRCSDPCDPPCLPPCPPREICCPERRCYFARHCCCGAYLSKYLSGATADAAMLDAIDAVKDLMSFLEECADDPDYYKPSMYFDIQCPDDILRQRMLKECRKRVECEPICVIPPDRCEPPC